MTSGAQAVATALPNATFQLLDGQGHGVDPDVIGPVLTEFFEKLRDPKRDGETRRSTESSP
jgi:hypothetical protein